MISSGLRGKPSIKHFGVLLAERGRMVSVRPMRLLRDLTRSKRDYPGKLAGFFISVLCAKSADQGIAARWRSAYAAVVHDRKALVEIQGRASKSTHWEFRNRKTTVAALWMRLVHHPAARFGPRAVGIVAVTRRLDRPAAAAPAAWRYWRRCAAPRRE